VVEKVTAGLAVGKEESPSDATHAT